MLELELFIVIFLQIATLAVIFSDYRKKKNDRRKETSSVVPQIVQFTGFSREQVEQIRKKDQSLYTQDTGPHYLTYY